MECLAIGSLPYKNPQKAIETVQKYFKNIPFWPQLSKVSKNEDMTIQFLEGMPSFFYPKMKIFHLIQKMKNFFTILKYFYLITKI